jgi:riboflavin biosynthesis pyrimidine reductase
VIDLRTFSERKLREAESVVLRPLATLEDRASAPEWIGIGNTWTRCLYDGPFYLPAETGTGGGETPLVSLVFVQSRDGNTGAENPGDLGGGPVDHHLVYEGLSRVAADAVLAGGKTVEGEEVFFSVWHPELVSLRADAGLPRHPAQIVVTGRGCVDLERSLVFNVPDVPVFILSNPGGCARLEAAVSRRPHVELVPIHGTDLRSGLEYLRRERGIRRISAVGGRTTASSLFDAGLVQDLVLTTSARAAGEPSTPLYVGDRPPVLTPVVRKRGTDPEYPIVVEQMAVSMQGSGIRDQGFGIRDSGSGIRDQGFNAPIRPNRACTFCAARASLRDRRMLPAPFRRPMPSTRVCRWRAA